MPRENECKRNIYPRGKINVSAVIVVSRKQMEEEEGERRGVGTVRVAEARAIRHRYYLKGMSLSSLLLVSKHRNNTSQHGCLRNEVLSGGVDPA